MHCLAFVSVRNQTLTRVDLNFAKIFCIKKILEFFILADENLQCRDRLYNGQNFLEQFYFQYSHAIVINVFLYKDFFPNKAFQAIFSIKEIIHLVSRK